MHKANDQDLRVAHELQRSGQLQAAADIYRRILKADPARADVRCQYGVVLAQLGKTDGALQQIRQSVRAEPNNVGYRMALAEVLEQAGNVPEAIKSYEAVLVLKPGFIAAQGAVANLLQRQGRLADAERVYRAILDQSPQSIPALVNLGNVLHEQERYEDAVACFRNAIQLAPTLAEAYNNLGNTLNALQEYDEATKVLEHAVLLRPDYAEAYNNLGNGFLSTAELAKAQHCYERAVALLPTYAEALHNLASVYKTLKRYDAALEYCAQALALKPDFTDALMTQGLIYAEQGCLTEAEQSFVAAKKIAPADPDVWMNLCGVMQDSGRLNEAVDCYRSVLAMEPDASTHSTMLFSLHYPSGIAPEAMFAEHRHWGQLQEQALPRWTERVAACIPDKKLRIGYLSPDFYAHPVATFLEPILAHYDKKSFEIFCYANVKCEDEVTRRLRSMAHAWRNIAGRSAQAVAEMVAQDDIDILVDLAGHTGYNRLDVFAIKPAPVQVTYLGYADTTGLTTVDYRLTDAWADPPGMTEQFHTEQLLRLPNSFLCYVPSEEAPVVEPPPATGNGYVTFGSFNNLPKISDETVALWVRILSAVEGSRLFLKSKALADAGVGERLLKRFAELGVGPERIELARGIPGVAGHLAAYGRMDIALDTFPYHGTTTTCEALWMGVPVISLAGKVHVSRVGVSILSNVGVPECVAQTPDEYVQKAVALAADRQRLVDLRTGLRERMRNSPLCDVAKFVGNLEAAYRDMWQTYCQSDSSAISTNE